MERAALYRPPENRLHANHAHAVRAEEVVGPLAQVLASVAAGGTHNPIPGTNAFHPSSSSQPFATPELDMDVIMEAFADDLQQNQPKATMSQMSRTLLDYMNGDVESDESEPEESPTTRIFDDFHTGMTKVSTHVFQDFIIWSYTFPTSRRTTNGSGKISSNDSHAHEPVMVSLAG